VVSPERIKAMDEQGIDIEALSINPVFWYKAERDLAGQVVSLQNEKLAEICAAQPDRFVGLASVALQHPDLAADQLEDAVKRLGLRGALIGGSVNGEELSDAKFHPFWAKAEQLGVLIFIHPQGTAELGVSGRLKGNGVLENVIGNPLETTLALSHLIFEGTLDAYPGLKSVRDVLNALYAEVDRVADVDRATEGDQEVSPEAVRYARAALQATNDRSNRLTRGTVVRELLLKAAVSPVAAK
jgi:predicted TIM-barrel fold metal-dependent hydrolase